MMRLLTKESYDAFPEFIKDKFCRQFLAQAQVGLFSPISPIVQLFCIKIGIITETLGYLRNWRKQTELRRKLTMRLRTRIHEINFNLHLRKTYHLWKYFLPTSKVTISDSRLSIFIKAQKKNLRCSEQLSLLLIFKINFQKNNLLNYFLLCMKTFQNAELKKENRGKQKIRYNGQVNCEPSGNLCVLISLKHFPTYFDTMEYLSKLDQRTEIMNTFK